MDNQEKDKTISWAFYRVFICPLFLVPWVKMQMTSFSKYLASTSLNPFLCVHQM